MKTRIPFALAITLLTPAWLDATMVVDSSPGFTVVWDGNDGEGFSPTSPAPVPANLVTAAGTTVFTSSDLGPQLGIQYHVAANLNDGLYGNANSWIGGNAPNPYAAVTLGALFNLTGFAFGRDNGNGAFDDSTPGTDGCGGQCDDRSLGLYIIQITRIAAPDASTQTTGNPATGWQTVGTLNYQSTDDDAPGGEFTSYLRHEFGMAAGAGAIAATGFRILVPATGLGSGTAIDEIELFGAPAINPDSDGDGFDDVVEVALGFNPNDPASTPESRTEIRTAVEFMFYAAKGKKYRIEGSTDLKTWTVVEDNVVGAGVEIQRFFSTVGLPNRHFRAVRIP